MIPVFEYIYIYIYDFIKTMIDLFANIKIL